MKTINSESVSRNTEHLRALETVWKLIEDVPVVFDREFSYEGFLEQLRAKKQPFVIRLNTGNRVKFTNKSGEPAQWNIPRGEVCVLRECIARGVYRCPFGGSMESGFFAAALGDDLSGKAAEGVRDLHAPDDD